MRTRDMGFEHVDIQVGSCNCLPWHVHLGEE